jgi:hypothetical protein
MIKVFHDLKTQRLQEPAPIITGFIEKTVDHIFARQRFSGGSFEQPEQISSLKDQLKDDLKNSQAGQTESLANTGFSQMLTEF